MCGIAGIAGAGSGGGGSVDKLGRMLSALARRGPDGEGVEAWPNARFGHRRLAILDLSEAGRQPMLTEDRSVGVTFNGCIYNFLDLRRDLEARGHRFRSQCDTEVLVRGYQEWGIDELARRVRGMYALAIWDEPRQTLYLVRDRLGVKPLVYIERDGRLTFASTVTALRAAGEARELDDGGALEFLEYGYLTDERSIYQDVQKLPAASLLEWRDGRVVSTRQYWTLPEPDEASPVPFEKAVERTEELLVEAVRLRLQSDVPIGALLSAGIDSALVCWALKELKADITAFTVSTPGDPADEAGAAQETAGILGIPHRVVTLPREGSGILEDLTQAYGEPFASQSALAMLRVSQAVRPHATVLLTGDGGDDVFLGYAFYGHYWRAQRIARRLPPGTAPVWRNVIRPLVAGIPALRRPRHFLDYITGGLGAVTRAGNGLPFYQENGLLGERLAGRELPQRQIPLSADSGRALLKDLLGFQQKNWFVAHFLTKVDGATMYHALEARSPFLDHTLWDFAGRLPYGLRMRGGEFKAVLREIVRRRVSPAVANRGKQGFTVPVEKWLQTDWRPALEVLRGDSCLARAGWIRRDSLERTWQRYSEAEQLPRQIWFALVLENWLRRRG